MSDVHDQASDDVVTGDVVTGDVNSDDAARMRLRWGVYWLLIALAAGNATGRILAVTSVNRFRPAGDIERRVRDEMEESRAKYEAEGVSPATVADRMQRRETELRKRLRRERPFLSSNDRSRWCTIRALVEHGTYAIDDVVTKEDERSIWDTIDMVKHTRSGQPQLYSSKPTLLPTLLAGEYWLIRKATGLTLAEDYYFVVRLMLITLNVPALVVIIFVTARMAERFGRSDWGRIFVVATAAFGTLLTSFVVVLNNHLIAASSAAVALAIAVSILCDDRRAGWRFAVAGLFGAFTAANELPALTFFGLLGLLLLWYDPRRTLVWGLPAALLVVAGSLGTNYLAHRTIVPAYAYRVPGEDYQGDNWYNYTFVVGGKEVDGEIVGGRTVDSYWKRDESSYARRSRIDQGESSRAVYVLHCLVGHHGIFSLTPVWLISLFGIFLLARHSGDSSTGKLALLIGLPTVICLLFYLSQGVENRNYGGVSSGLRWMLWLAPLWLLAMVPAADWIARSRMRRAFGLLLVACSVLSASYPTWNPWSHPWIAKWMSYMGWMEL